MVIENENTRLKEDSDEYKQKYDDIDFKLKMLKEKEKIHESSVSNLKDVQRNYENSLVELKKDYKTKEDNLWTKYDNLEEDNCKKLKEMDTEYIEKIDHLNYQLKESEKQIEKV